MKTILRIAGVVAALTSWGAHAQGRYVEPPPVLVSPDLSAPWVMQLRPGAAAPAIAQQRVRSRTPQEQEYRLYQRARGGTQSRAAAGAYRPNRAQAPAAAARPVVYNAFPSDRFYNMNDPKWQPQVVEYETKEAPGTIVIDTGQRFLYLVRENGTALRYGVGVGKEGFGWTGTETITQKREWPEWRPPAEMIAREKAKGRVLPAMMRGGPANPLGARALYLGSTLYRIHGTNAPWTIGRAVSSGCIRMRNEDVIDLYGRVSVGTKVKVI